MNALEMLEPISLTDAAITKIKNLITAEGNENLKLRIYIVGGGCSGFKYGFALDSKINEDDIVINKDNITVLVDALCAPYLNNAIVDYKESLRGSQFEIHNPNSETTCGCGSSFSLKEE